MINVGILFGSPSREREVSFAGGRTVYDNLDKRLFNAIPLFVDSFGNMVELSWEFIYKGSIRDFYPPVAFLPASPHEYQIYAESLHYTPELQPVDLLRHIGKPMTAEALKGRIDFAFLALHGPSGEDGTIQGMLEWLGIPYSGSGILPSAIGISKRVQKNLQKSVFATPAYIELTREQWLIGDSATWFNKAITEVGLPMVIKSANQGSSIGVTVLDHNDQQAFAEAVNRSLFRRTVYASAWQQMEVDDRVEFVRQLTDIREGIGIPLLANGREIRHPEDLLHFLGGHFKNHDQVMLEAIDGETEVLIEQFIRGKEFSCIVVEDDNGTPIALPPTEIVKGTQVFDYRSKYLPGLSRKVTPINLPAEQIEAIRKECERLYSYFGFNVYARIDGFIQDDGTVFLNDPNTTSGMMPSSFFFHQAAEVGLNPSQFLTFIIRNSLASRIRSGIGLRTAYRALLQELDAQLEAQASSANNLLPVAVIMGGYSTERHISVESGRNIYEKLASSGKYQPVPVFLTGNDVSHELYVLPINMMLKDNADDILEKIRHFSVHPVLENIRRECAAITAKYNPAGMVAAPQQVDYNALAGMVKRVFIALHGRPGEDGALQVQLEKVGLPYNGSGVQSSQITINKFETNELLRQNGFRVAGHMLVYKEQWRASKADLIRHIEETIGYPLIAKPADDGCSSAVKKINDSRSLEHFAELMFRDMPELTPEHAAALKLKPNEEFPYKPYFLVEEYINKGDAMHFLEVTGGMLTHRQPDGTIRYEIFEPSETLAESDILSLEEKFLAGQGQNITPARFARDKDSNAIISAKVREELGKAARLLNIEGYCRIDAFVKIYPGNEVQVYFIEVNSLPGMTPATCIFHQSAINGYKPFEFIDKILEYGVSKFQTA